MSIRVTKTNWGLGGFLRLLLRVGFVWYLAAPGVCQQHRLAASATLPVRNLTMCLFNFSKLCQSFFSLERLPVRHDVQGNDHGYNPMDNVIHQDGPTHAANGSVMVFLHQMKTAGTAFYQVVSTTCAPCESKGEVNGALLRRLRGHKGLACDEWCRECPGSSVCGHLGESPDIDTGLAEHWTHCRFAFFHEEFGLVKEHLLPILGSRLDLATLFREPVNLRLSRARFSANISASEASEKLMKFKTLPTSRLAKKREGNVLLKLHAIDFLLGITHPPSKFDENPSPFPIRLR